MASFSYQNHYPFLLDTAAYLPTTPTEALLLPPQLGEVSTASCCCLHNCYPSSDATPEVLDAMNYESSLGLVPQVTQSHMEEKRKDIDESCSSPLQSKDTKESKTRKRKNLRACEKKVAKSCVNPSTEYIHVRARRGQATDSHSLAERVRREKIRERMKMLQDLVPGCDKVTGKALMLDEIINYVQSLQNQVEFLSMKLASVSPVSYDSASDFEGHTNHPEMPSVLQAHHIQPTAFGDTTSSLGVLENSVPAVSLHGHGPTAAFSQGSSSALVQVAEPMQGLLHQVVFNNMFTTFQ